MWLFRNCFSNYEKMHSVMIWTLDSVTQMRTPASASLGCLLEMQINTPPSTYLIWISGLGAQESFTKPSRFCLQCCCLRTAQEYWTHGSYYLGISDQRFLEYKSHFSSPPHLSHFQSQVLNKGLVLSWLTLHYPAIVLFIYIIPSEGREGYGHKH